MLSHMTSCNNCAPILLENLTLNSCPDHIIPRKIYEDYYGLRYY